MPFNPNTNTFTRLWKFVDHRSAGDSVSRVDLDISLDDLAEAVNSINSFGGTLIGEWDASEGTFPATRPDGNPIRTRDAWVVSDAGTVNGVSFDVGDFLVSLKQAPGQTYAGNWALVSLSQMEELAQEAADSADSALQSAGMIGLRPEDFGAVGGYVVDTATRTVFNAATAIAPVRVQYLWLLERTIRRFQRARVWASVTATAGTGGYVDFTASGLTSREQVAFDWINERYELARDGANGAGAIATTEQLDAAAAIDLTANTTAMRAWLAAVQAPGAIGRLGPITYPVNDTLRLNGVRIEGFKGLSRIQMGPAVDYNVQLAVCGITDEPAADVNVYGVIFDGNYERRKGGSAGSGIGHSSLHGTTLCLSYLRDSKFEACEAWDARKHAIDVTGSAHGRSGTPYVYPAQAQVSQNIELIDCVAEGAGDDLLTTHNCLGVDIVRPKVAFSTGDFFVSEGENSNGIEIDDGSVGVRVYAGYAAFCYTALEIKGHSDAVAASDCSVQGMKVEHANNGVIIRHVGHGGEAQPQSPSAKNIRIGDVAIKSPLEWRTGATKAALRYYAYETTKIMGIQVDQAGAPDDYYGTDETGSDGVIQVILGGKDISFDSIQVNGFPDVIAALRVTSTTRGYVNVDQVNTSNGPMRGAYHTGGATVTIGGGSLHRNTATAGSIGIRGVMDMTRVGPLTTTNFEQRHSFSTTVTTMRREDGILLDATFDLDTFGATTSGQNYAFDRSFSWGASVPANAPCDFATMNHLNRTNGSRSQIVYETASRRRIFYRTYTGSAWTGWDEIQKIESGVTANRPAQPTIGAPYFNTVTNTPEWWNGSEWVNATHTMTSIAATPDYLGQTAVVAGEGYIAVGVSSSADWKQIT